MVLVRSLSLVEGRREMVVFFLNDGDGISEPCEVIICPGKVVVAYLLTDRNYLPKSAVILEFLYLLLMAWVEVLSEWHRSFQESRE